ncbi:DUF2948 family protein [Silicimonas sp. MF1-12-2]|jgi:hypothetical protein|uniref:DUF2948 family protein n=1 Tax=Silicimonas sp. MF1-12-2 TaxID=3384793 RepID=UPI0039B3CF0C
MTEDARFEDGGERPLRLKALEPEDLPVIAALIQDAVFPVTEMHWDRKRRRFALLINRFRWEDKSSAERRGRAFERVQSVLAFEDVLTVQTQGLDRSDKDLVLSLLTLTFSPGEDASGRLELTLAGDGAVAVDVEALEVTLRDVTRPYVAPSRRAPGHPE